MAVKDFNNKVAAVTGAGSGMGRGLAIKLAAAGCHLSLADIDEEGLRETESLVTGTVNVTSHVVDVASPTEMENFAVATAAAHGGVNLIFNNAGVSVTGLAERMPFEDIEWVMNINFWGVVYGCRFFLPYLREADEAAIVNTSSIFGTIAVPSQSAYNASKFAVRGYSYSLRTELADTHIGVSCVQPGGVKTNIVRKSRYIPEDNESVTREEMVEWFDTQFARLTAEQAAERILKGVLKNRAQILVGGDARIAAFIERLAPASYLKLMRKGINPQSG